MTYAGSAYGAAPYAGTSASDSEPILTLAAQIPGLSSVMSLDAASPVEIAGTLPGLTASFAMDAAAEVISLSLSASLPGLTGALSVDAASPIVLTATLPGLTSALTLSVVTPNQSSLVGVLPNLTAAFVFVKPPETDRTNRVGGLKLGGFGVATWSPPPVEPPALPLLVHNYDVTHAFTEAEIVGARPVYDVTFVQKPAATIRILVNNKDVTFLRDVPTPPPSYSLMEPFVYGAGQLELPQVNPMFERLGMGALSWLTKEAPVRVQALDPDTGAVLADDYRGFIESFDIRGNTLVCGLSGELTGRLEMMDRQPPIFREVADVGRWVYFLHSRLGGVKFAPFGGPVTGIKLPSRGGQSMLAYGQELLALAVHEDGSQWTVGRRDNGTYGMWLKDTTTVHATIYLDDARMVGDIHSTLGEEPNRVYASGLSPAGERIKFGVYPGMVRTEPAVYPYANTATTFGIGTTALDTDNPALGLIEVMIWRLVNMGLMSFTDATGGYDADVASAIKRLQAKAGLSRTGIMNYNTWRALYNITTTGASIANSRIEPAAQQDYVRPWDYTADGAESAKNVGYQAHRIKVDRSINTGSDFTRQQMARFAQGVMRDSTLKNWAGTITGHLAAIVGEHNYGDPLTEADLMPLRELKPGMNVWVPNFDGGTLFHVSGKEVPSDGPPVLAVDTRARDLMPLWEVIARNRESRNNPARIWLNQNRSSGITKDAFIEFDEIGGVLDAMVSLSANTWNVFPVIAGQAGTIARVRLSMTNPCRFGVMIFAKSIREGRLNKLIGNPLSEAGQTRFDRLSVRSKLEARGLTYSAGTPDDAAGYWPGNQVDGGSVTGVHQDDGGFGYHTFAEPVLYVAVYPLENTKVRPGRVLWNQLDAGA